MSVSLEWSAFQCAQSAKINACLTIDKKTPFEVRNLKFGKKGTTPSHSGIDEVPPTPQYPRADAIAYVYVARP